MENKLDQLINQIPDRFTVNSQTYIVSLEREVNLDGKPQLGIVDLHKVNSQMKIAMTLGEDHPVDKAQILNTYYHELFHVLLTHACIPDEEVVVQSLANLFMQYELGKEYNPDESRMLPESTRN